MAGDRPETISREMLALRVARALAESGARYVNLGIGLPTLVSNFIPDVADIVLQSENGMLAYGPLAEPGEEDVDYRNAGGQYITMLDGASFFDSAFSFSLIRGGKLDATVLGGFQVSQHGDLANWKRPNRPLGSMGGALDLVLGAKQVIVAMEHITKSGEPKIVRECSYPVTGRRCVSLIITDLAVIAVTSSGLELREFAQGSSLDEVQRWTDAPLIVTPATREMAF